MSVRIKTRKRRITWEFVIAFLLGAVFAEATADPISDMLFFLRSSKPQPLSPIEQVVYWYFLPAAVYATFLLIAFLFMRFKFTTASSFVMVIMILAGIGTLISWKALGGNPLILLMLLIPLTLLVYVLTHKTVVKVRRSVVTL
jgi:hypothetical protein